MSPNVGDGNLCSSGGGISHDEICPRESLPSCNAKQLPPPPCARPGSLSAQHGRPVVVPLYDDPRTLECRTLVAFETPRARPFVCEHSPTPSQICHVCRCCVRRKADGDSRQPSPGSLLLHYHFSCVCLRHLRYLSTLSPPPPPLSDPPFQPTARSAERDLWGDRAISRISHRRKPERAIWYRAGVYSVRWRRWLVAPSFLLVLGRAAQRPWRCKTGRERRGFVLPGGRGDDPSSLTGGNDGDGAAVPLERGDIVRARARTFVPFNIPIVRPVRCGVLWC